MGVEPEDILHRTVETGSMRNRVGGSDHVTVVYDEQVHVTRVR